MFETLSDYIDELKHVNNNLLFSLSTKVTEKDRNVCMY